MPDTPEEPRGGRRERRKERTRTALVGAARRLLLERDGRQASIQTITELADVGFGSFYNHFASKEDLFEAARDETVADYFAWLDARLEADADPVRRLTESIRLTGRLIVERPELAQALSRADRPAGTDALSRRMEADVRAALAAADIVVGAAEFETLLVATLGAIRAVVERAAGWTPTETAANAEVLAPAVTRLLGLPENAGRPGSRAGSGPSSG